MDRVNLTAAKKIVGTMPFVENVATLIDPPASQLSEADWTSETSLRQTATCSSTCITCTRMQ